MGSSTLEEVFGQFEDAESDDDASPSLFSKSFAVAALSPPKCAPPVAKTKKALGQASGSSFAASAPLSVPGSEKLRQVECHRPACPRRASAETVRGTGQPRLVGGPPEVVHVEPHSRGSSRPMMKPHGVTFRAPAGPGAALPEPSSRSPFYKPIAPRGGLDEMSRVRAGGYRSPWLPNAAPALPMHPVPPLNGARARPSVRVLTSGETVVERIEVERISFPEEGAGAASSSSDVNVPVSASRKASFKRVVLGAGSGEVSSASGGSKQRSRPSAVVDAARAMTELSRQSPSGAPLSTVCPSSALYLQMTHPHPSIAPRVPSRSLGDGAQATALPWLAVESDFEAKKNPIVSLAEKDIILGRGGQANHHPGNIWFRTVIQSYRMHYCVLVKGDKMQMARNLANWFYLSGARFLIHSDKGGWFEAGSDRASKKCSQSLREGTCSIVRKTLEGSILVGTDASAGIVGCHSNTVTPTSQLEQRDASSASTVTSESQKPGPTPANAPRGTTAAGQNQSRDGKRDSGIHREGDGPRAAPKRMLEGGSYPTTTNWENWRKRARESTS